MAEHIKTTGRGFLRKTGGAIRSSSSPLTRKIIAFNLVALSLLVTGILYLNQSREGLIDLRRRTLIADTNVMAMTLAENMQKSGAADIFQPDLLLELKRFSQILNSQAQLFAVDGRLITNIDGHPEAFRPIHVTVPKRTNAFNDLLADALKRLSSVFGSNIATEITTQDRQANNATIADFVMSNGAPRMETTKNFYDEIIITAAVPIVVNNVVQGAVVLSTLGGEIDSYLSGERRQILQMFFLAILTSILLSVLLANTIGKPLKDLAAAAKRGSLQKSGRLNPGRIDIPDLSARPDEIGELSRQLRNMTNALYDRIEANETFAADVAHEIKNPLTSLGSAVESMQYAKTDESRNKLLDVISDDVRRMDRLVTDISNASRLDAELATDDMEVFDICALLANIANYQHELASKAGVTVKQVLPVATLEFTGFENRLAQVFVNLIANAVSFVPNGGEVRVSLEPDDNHVTIHVEDTGPGIPDENLKDIFKRFYSSRPKQEFGNNSGLGLAISRQIVEAHAGHIIAENIRNDDAGDPIGARFIVTLPL